MRNKDGINIFDFDLYAKRISFFYKKRDEIGTAFGLFLTFLYVVLTLVIFILYLSKTIRRSDVKSQESTVYSQGLPSIDVNRKLFYFAFALENPLTQSRFIDEGIYYPKVYFIKQYKENGIFITKEKIDLKVERCGFVKFGEEYKGQFTEAELNNSYCLTDVNFTLVGGAKYEKSSFIEIKMHPCSNKTENNNHCKPQNIIDSHLNSGYFSMTIKDIGLDPLNYSFPVIPIIQNVKTNVDITMCRESLIYMGIAQIHTDEGLFSQKIKIERFLEYRKYSQSFFFIDETEYHQGKEIFGAQIKLEEYIHVQKREYTKMSEVFSVTGGYMQLISTIFALITLLSKNFNVEKKILNRLFNFNIKKRKIILSIQYDKKLHYLIHFENEFENLFIPYGASKSLNPYKILNLKINNHLKKNEILNFNSNNEFLTLAKKYNSGKINNIKNINNKKSYSENEEGHETIQIIKSKLKYQNVTEQNNNKSKMIMLFKDDDLNDLPINTVFDKKKHKEIGLYSSSNNNIIPKEKDLITYIDFNILDYVCECKRRNRKKYQNIEIFNFGINFYKNQMSIINIFNIIFLGQMLITNYLYKKNKNMFNQIIEIPIKT